MSAFYAVAAKKIYENKMHFALHVYDQNDHAIAQVPLPQSLGNYQFGSYFYTDINIIIP